MGKRRLFSDPPEETEDQSPVKKETKQHVPKRGIVCNARLVRVRKEPNGSADIVKVLENGDEVKIIEKSVETFYKIDLGNEQIGYISCEYCEEVK